MAEILVALITGGLTLVGVILTNAASQWKTGQAIATAQAVTDAKLDDLTREVREHNNFAKRMPVLEQKVETLKEQVQELKEAQKHD